MVETIITSSALIVVIVLVRAIFRGRISRRFQYALWGLVLLRLLWPFPLLPSPASMMNVVDTARLDATTATVRVTVRPLVPYTPAEYAAEKGVPLAAIDAPTLESAARERASRPLDEVLRMLWLSGAIAVGFWFTVTNGLFYRHLRTTRRPFAQPDCHLPVYTAPGLPSPCLFGLIRPAVYLTPEAVTDGGTIRDVVTHELCHHAHGDQIWSLLRGVCLALHWFNPLVWLAAILSRTDCELACDEAAVRRLGAENRLRYGRTLVDMIAVRSAPTGLMCAATTMAAGSRGIRERLETIVKNQRTVLSALLAALLIVAIGAGCSFTGANSRVARKIKAGLNDADPLVRQAWTMIEQDVKSNENAVFTDAEIIKLERVATYEGLYSDATVEVYQLQYRLRPKDPSKVMLAGGMTIEDGWLREVCSMGSPYLVAKRPAGSDKVSYLGIIWPEGEGFGELNATLELKYRLDAEAGAPVANAPLQVSQAFALSSSDLNPEEAALELTMRFMESLRGEEDLTAPRLKTFVITEYEGLKIKLFPATGAPAEYKVADWEKNDHSWIVEPSVRLRYKGKISPLGDGAAVPDGQWITELDQGNHVGLLLTKDGDTYVLRSRYYGADGQPR